MIENKRRKLQIRRERKRGTEEIWERGTTKGTKGFRDGRMDGGGAAD